MGTDEEKSRWNRRMMASSTPRLCLDLELTLWVTILAVIWLHSFAADTKLEWDLLVNKSLSWVKATGAPDLADCVKAANALLKTCVLPKTLGL
ncbi:von Willebrand factor A domain-containing protein 5A-like [Leucoraja erinacea]|uniref:von Willebrand factor A domain-containing protein 5A-like n=1 Tax=Leucoraja erinaceus TaxID=7782 RepID=UPI002455F4CF|nr:von Willebrand factor A domain-containing protein 5A-like [Leucoraja erinacea]XP_055522341.1 von Willebrand factor A domain-containing protein 5A-like [Leucoraja erinacea]